jgi:hypothetical protein
VNPEAGACEISPTAAGMAYAVLDLDDAGEVGGRVKANTARCSLHRCLSLQALQLAPSWKLLTAQLLLIVVRCILRLLLTDGGMHSATTQ